MKVIQYTILYSYICAVYMDIHYTDTYAHSYIYTDAAGCSIFIALHVTT